MSLSYKNKEEYAYMPMTKEFKTVEQQIRGLEQRNLKFKNKRRAVEILYKYNYFDIINGFESILLKQGTSQKVYENVYERTEINRG